ncbi:MAG: roadblock/LC7 domain-containing protein [Promethearchaeia archaeon]
MREDSELLRKLEQIRSMGNICGIILARKNGEPITKTLSQDFKKVMTDLENFSAMCATAFEGGMGIAYNSNKKGITQIFAELADHNLVIKECNEEMILIMVLIKSMNVSNLMADFNNLVKKINESLEN